MQTCKVAFVGQCGVGKTRLVSYMANDPPEWRHPPTIGADYRMIRCEDRRYGVWDVSGSENYESLARQLVHGCDVVVGCFSISQKSSLSKAFALLSQHSDKICVLTAIVDERHDAYILESARSYCLSAGIGFCVVGHLPNKKFCCDELVRCLAQAPVPRTSDTEFTPPPPHSQGECCCLQ